MICRRTSQSRPGLGRTVPDGATEYSQALAEQVTINEDGFLKPDGNRINAQVDYEYDDLYRLVHEHRIAYNGGDPGVAYEYNFAYDDAGNRTSWQTVGGSTISYAYDAANKMTSPGTFTYDDKGNTLTHTASSITTTYTWDYLNRMTQWQKTGETTQTYVYNADGMRVRVTPSGGTSTNFLLDRREIAEEITSASVISYVGPGLVSRIAGETRTIYHADGIGSTRAMSDSDQAVVEVGIYDAYGNETIIAGTSPNLGYAGMWRYYSDSTGMSYLKARYYDPVSGRFVSRDPLGFRGGANLYEYARNNPMGFTDPTGEIAWAVILPIIAAGYTVYEAVCLYRAWEAGNEVANDGKDKQAHCLMACRIKRCLGGGLGVDATLYIGMWLWELLGGVFDPADVDAGVAGLGCSYCSGSSCGGCCAAALSKPKNCPKDCGK